MSDASPADLIERLQSVFADQYEIESEMPSGGMSRLFLARDTTLNRRVVIKILPPELTSEMTIARFKRESELTARLQHPHILPVIGAGVRDGLMFYIAPYVSGESLRAKLQREGALPIDVAVTLLREVAGALAYAHEHGVIHRDIKPENILLQGGHAILADFGIAAAFGGTQAGHSRLTRTGMAMGTVGYMAPEQSFGEQDVDGRADIYSLGVVGYELVAGRPPFSGVTTQALLTAQLTEKPTPLPKLRSDTPGSVSAALERALRTQASERWATAAEFRDALVAPATRARHRLAPTPVDQLVTRKRVAMAAAALLVLAGAAGAWWKFGRGAESVETISIAIAPFDTFTPGLELWREGMVDVMSRNIDGAGPLRAVSPSLSIKGWSAPADRGKAIALARRTGARYVMFGTLTGSAFDSVRLRASLHDREANTTWEYESRHPDVNVLADSLALAALRELSRTHRLGAFRRSSLGSGSVVAIKAFLQGEQFYRRTAWDSAETSYAAAIAQDSQFALALRRMASVISWQRGWTDSVARDMALRAGAHNRRLSPRDSLLVHADSLRAALSLADIESLDWGLVRRLFATVDTAAARYPGDPDVWYTVGEAREHHGYSSITNISDLQVLEAFDRSIALDSSFSPAYVHAIEHAFALYGRDKGLQYARTYLAQRPTDEDASAIALATLIASAGPDDTALDRVLDTMPVPVIFTAWSALRRWPDTSERPLRLLRAVGRRDLSPSDSLGMRQRLPFQLAYYGRFREAHQLIGNRVTRLFAELAWLGAIHPDSAAPVLDIWVKERRPQVSSALPWWARRGDIASIRAYGASSQAADPSDTRARRRARYVALATEAYSSLARGDTTAALERFDRLSDTLCVGCYADRLTHARLLGARGRSREALTMLSRRLYTFFTPLEIEFAAERARAAEKAGDADAASRNWLVVRDAWSRGDPEVQSVVREARDALTRLARGR